MHFCDPNQLIATKQRNKLAAVNKALCYLTRGSFKEDQHTQASLTCVCLSLRLFVRTVWRRSRRRLRSRSSNENRKRRMLRRRLLSMRRIDRPPQAKKIWGLRRIVCTLITVGASWPQAVHGRLSRCKRLPLILDRASTPAWLATLRPVRPPGSELRLLPNQCSKIVSLPARRVSVRHYVIRSSRGTVKAAPVRV